MIFKEQKMAKDVAVIIGAGGIGMAIARRQGVGKTVLLADWNADLLAKAAQELEDDSYSGDAGGEHRWPVAQYGQRRQGAGC
jgi:NADP-dependent 3-hydroxy acid dehydrogenase YdfG